MVNFNRVRHAMTHEELFQIPVVLFIFNRPETTRKVFSVIKNIRPSYFFSLPMDQEIIFPVKKKSVTQSGN